MARQLVFDLPVTPNRSRGDFYISPSNRLAHDSVMAPSDWPNGKLILTGPKGAGKTHLAHVWAEQFGAKLVSPEGLSDIQALACGPVAVDDADRIAHHETAQRALFHLHNLVLAEGHPLLLTARLAPSRWDITLPDLASRMQGTTLAVIAPPDDALLSAVLVKLFADRQIEVNPSLVAYLVKRMERSLAAAADLVDLLDRAALTERRPITRDFARKVLAG